MKRTTLSTTFLLAGSLLLAACGGAGAGAGPGTGGTPPPATAKTTRGVITDLSATTITVNGVRLDDSRARVRIEGVERSHADLRRGMVVEARGTFDDRGGAAAEIAFEDAVKGRVDGKGTDDLLVGGTRVRIDDSTEFEHAGRLDDVRAGDRIRVSGVPDDRGGLRATRIDRDSRTDDSFEVKGFVAGLSATGFTLLLSPDAASGLAVTLAAGLTLPAGLADGDYVEIHGASAPQNGAVVAIAVHREDRHGVEGSEIEVEGIVTSGTSAQFVVDGQTVITNASTRWQYGTPDDLRVGVKVEAEGHVVTDGNLVAEKVSFRAALRLQAAVSNVALSGPTGTFQLMGLTISASDLTDWRIGPSALAGGVVVEVRGMPSRDGTGVIATRIEEAGGGSSSRIFVTGPVTAKDDAAGTLQILGFTVLAGSASFHDHSEAPLSREAFFAAVEPGRTLVKARGRSAAALSGTTLTAEELELEND